jgi:hypothetical protein
MEWQDYRDRDRARRAPTSARLGASPGWHLTTQGRICFETGCRCPSRPRLPGRVERLGDRLSSRSHLGLLLLAAVVALVLLLHG